MKNLTQPKNSLLTYEFFYKGNNLSQCSRNLHSILKFLGPFFILGFFQQKKLTCVAFKQTLKAALNVGVFRIKDRLLAMKDIKYAKYSAINKPIHACAVLHRLMAFTKLFLISGKQKTAILEIICTIERTRVNKKILNFQFLKIMQNYKTNCKATRLLGKNQTPILGQIIFFNKMS